MDTQHRVRSPTGIARGKLDVQIPLRCYEQRLWEVGVGGFPSPAPKVNAGAALNVFVVSLEVCGKPVFP